MKSQVRRLQSAGVVFGKAVNGVCHLDAEIFTRDFGQAVAGAIWVEQVSRQQRVVFDAFDPHH